MAGKDEKREVAPAEEAGLGEEAEECYITHTEFRDPETGAAADMDTGVFSLSFHMLKQWARANTISSGETVYCFWLLLLWPGFRPLPICACADNI